MQQELLITWGVAAALLLAALVVAWPMLRIFFARRRMERAISRSGVDCMRNVLIEDGMGGMVFYEWLLLTPRKIRIFLTSGRSGIIFAGERMDSWAQVVGKRTTRFSNPLYNLEELLATLRYHLPNLPLEGSMLFVGDCRFPKGRPDSVITLDELTPESDDENEAVLPVLEEAWQMLGENSRKADPKNESYLLPLREPTAWGRWIMVVLLLAALAGWLYWRQ